jgi:hypothetical protein
MTKVGRQRSAEPLIIADNFYVGASDAAAFLITGLRDTSCHGGYPSTVPMIMECIVKLGFTFIKDVKWF